MLRHLPPLFTLLVQGVLQLRLDGWRPRALSLVLLVASQTVGLAIGVASAFVFGSPGTAAAVTCTYAYFLAIGTVALRWSHGGHRLPPRWRTGKYPRGSFLDVWSPHPLPCPLAGFADPGLPMSDFRRLAAPVCVQARYQDCWSLSPPAFVWLPSVRPAACHLKLLLCCRVDGSRLCLHCL